MAADAAVGRLSRAALQAPRGRADCTNNIASSGTGWTVRFHSAGGFTARPSVDVGEDASVASTEPSRALSTAEEIEHELGHLGHARKPRHQERHAARRSTAQQQRLLEMHAENTRLQGVVLALSEDRDTAVRAGGAPGLRSERDLQQGQTV